MNFILYFIFCVKKGNNTKLKKKEKTNKKTTSPRNGITKSEQMSTFLCFHNEWQTSHIEITTEKKTKFAGK